MGTLLMNGLQPRCSTRLRLAGLKYICLRVPFGCWSPCWCLSQPVWHMGTEGVDALSRMVCGLGGWWKVCKVRGMFPTSVT